MAQRNSEPVGDPTWGMEETVKEKAPSPVRLFEPDEDQGAHAGRQETWDQDDLHHGASQSGHLHEQEGADEG